jgi:D-amino peptidase
MRVYISVDIEGITGLVSWSQCSRPDGKSFDYAFARRMMTHDVNAAVRGARKAGAESIVIKDSHGNSKNLILDELEPGVRLVSGHGAGTDGMMQGIDSFFDCAMLVGYHAKAGTLGGVMEHTITGGVHRLWINGVESGEIGLSAGVAGQLGVPLVLVTSDLAGCAEALELIRGVETTITKKGLGRYMADLLHPSDTGPLIEAAAERAVRRRSEIAPVIWDEPTTIRAEFNRAEEADMAAKLAFAPTRVDGYTVERTFPTYEEAHRAAWNFMAMSFEGIGSQH